MEEGTILLVAHGGINKVILRTLKGTHLPVMHKDYHVNSSVSLLYIEGGVKFISEADTSHIE